jgi:xylulokinase
MYIGIDLGTSGVKAILLSEQGEVLATQTEKLQVSRPHPLWSEQDPEQWWQATDRAMKALGEQHSLRDVKALGIAGQMHGATLLDSEHRVLRPAILWNDGRCGEECAILEGRVPTSREITGNLMMPGFTAPKLLWVQRHEPEVFRQVAKVLLPKDYLRFRMTGDFASDMSDAAGTMWLDVAKRDWSEAMLDACHLTRDHMPALLKAARSQGHCSPPLPKAGTCRPCRWLPVVAIMRLVLWVSGWLTRGRRCSRWGHPASILRLAMVIAATLKMRCTVSAMPFRVSGI